MRFIPASKCSPLVLARVQQLRAERKTSRQIVETLREEGLAVVTPQTVMNWVNGRLPADLRGP